MGSLAVAADLDKVLQCCISALGGKRNHGAGGVYGK